MVAKTKGNANGDAAATVSAASFYSEEANLKLLCNFLRAREGPPVREAVQMDQRVYYLKGK